MQVDLNARSVALKDVKPGTCVAWMEQGTWQFGLSLMIDPDDPGQYDQNVLRFSKQGDQSVGSLIGKNRASPVLAICDAVLKPKWRDGKSAFDGRSSSKSGDLEIWGEEIFMRAAGDVMSALVHLSAGTIASPNEEPARGARAYPLIVRQWCLLESSDGDELVTYEGH